MHAENLNTVGILRIAVLAWESEETMMYGSLLVLICWDIFIFSFCAPDKPKLMYFIK